MDIKYSLIWKVKIRIYLLPSSAQPQLVASFSFAGRAELALFSTNPPPPGKFISWPAPAGSKLQLAEEAVGFRSSELGKAQPQLVLFLMQIELGFLVFKFRPISVDTGSQFDNFDDPGYPSNLLGPTDGKLVVVVVVQPNYRAISEPTYSRGDGGKVQPDYRTNSKLNLVSLYFKPLQ